MLPYFFRHYDSIVDRYFVWDSGSTDRSLDLLRHHRRVTVGRFERGESFILSATAHYNECWKVSRGAADWVIVVNVDEHLYHPRLRSYLRSRGGAGVSIVIAEGYHMVSHTFPWTRQPLWRVLPHGARDRHWDKPQVFDPNRIQEINFAPGRHAAEPIGNVGVVRTNAVRLLHYKYLGADYLQTRHAELRSVFPESDLARGWGYQYSWDAAQNREALRRHQAAAVNVVRGARRMRKRTGRFPVADAVGGEADAGVPVHS